MTGKYRASVAVTAEKTSFFLYTLKELFQGRFDFCRKLTFGDHLNCPLQRVEAVKADGGIRFPRPGFRCSLAVHKLRYRLDSTVLLQRFQCSAVWTVLPSYRLRFFFCPLPALGKPGSRIIALVCPHGCQHFTGKIRAFAAQNSASRFIHHSILLFPFVFRLKIRDPFGKSPGQPELLI